MFTPDFVTFLWLDILVDNAISLDALVFCMTEQFYSLLF